MGNPTTIASKKIKRILVKLLDEYSLGAKNSLKIIIRPDMFLADTDIDKHQFLRILTNLDERGVISNLVTKIKGFIHDPYQSMDHEFDLCEITLPKTFVARAEDYIEILSGDDKYEKTEPGSIIYFTESGDLWHGDKDQFCYSMRQTKERLAIVDYLIKNKGYNKTKDLAGFFGKTQQGVRTTINKIQSQIKIHLDIEDLIENEPGPGYRINPKYQIKKIK
jgi:hypothetical protein